MFLLLKLAWRNIFRNTRRTVLTGLAMTAGFVLSSLNFAFIEGSFGDSINAFTLAGAGHIQIHHQGYLDKPTLFDTFTQTPELGATLAKFPEIKAWTPRLYAPALAFIGARTTTVRLTGVDPVREPQTTRLLMGLRAGRTLTSASGHEVVIGGDLADNLRANVGDRLVLIAQAADGSVANDLFTIVGILKTSGGLSAYACYLPLGTAQAFLSLEGRVHELTLVLKDFRLSRPVAAAAAAALHDPGLEVKPWEDVEKQFYDLVQVKKKSSAVVLLIVYLIVCLGVVNTVTMSLLERTREFGVLLALGTRPSRLWAMIQFEVGWLSLLAIVVGTLLSIALDGYYAAHGIAYPHPIDIGGVAMERASAALNVGVILVPALLTLISAEIVSLLVAWRTVGLRPVQAMRQT